MHSFKIFFLHNSQLVNNSHIQASHTHKQYQICLANIVRLSKLHISSIALFRWSSFLVLERNPIFTEKVNSSGSISFCLKKCLSCYPALASEAQAWCWNPQTHNNEVGCTCELISYEPHTEAVANTFPVSLSIYHCMMIFFQFQTVTT